MVRLTCGACSAPPGPGTRPGRMVVPALGVRVPDLENGVGDRCAVAVQHAALDGDLVAAGTARREVAPFGVVHPEPEERAHRLRRRGGVLLHLPPSNGVDS